VPVEQRVLRLAAEIVTSKVLTEEKIPAAASVGV
jgi:hypothetical protein